MLHYIIFLNSDYCYDIEMQRAMERHREGSARAIPIILRLCDWKTAPFGGLKALPKDGKPVTKSPLQWWFFRNMMRIERAANE
jgi:hypothetical protein